MQCSGASGVGSTSALSGSSGLDIATCIADGYKCFVGQEFMLDLCYFVCDPLLQNCPDPLEACYSDDRGFTCLPDNSGDEGQVNDPCLDVDACDGGLICFPAVEASAACDPKRLLSAVLQVPW